MCNNDFVNTLKINDLVKSKDPNHIYAKRIYKIIFIGKPSNTSFKKIYVSLQNVDNMFDKKFWVDPNKLQKVEL